MAFLTPELMDDVFFAELMMGSAATADVIVQASGSSASYRSMTTKTQSQYSLQAGVQGNVAEDLVRSPADGVKEIGIAVWSTATHRVLVSNETKYCEIYLQEL
jgi:hypothetical protein